MKVVRISKDGISVANPSVIYGKQGNYLAFTHGEEGRGRWQYRLPLASRDFPAPNSAGSEINVGEQEFKLIDLNKNDSRGNPLFLLVKGVNDGKILVLWSLSPGYRGGSIYKVEGKAKILAIGKEAQGAAGRMGGADCPVVLVEGPCSLNWKRTGRLYGSKDDWVANYNGKEWLILPSDECSIESAALNW